MNTPTFKCVIHGSFGKHFDEIQKVAELFTNVGIEVLAPKLGNLTSAINGFRLFDDEEGQDPRLVELRYLHNLKSLGPNGFSYFIDPGGYIGASAAYELAIAQLTNVRCFFMEKPADHPVYIHNNAVWAADNLINYILDHQALPLEMIRRNEKLIHKLWTDLMVPGSVIATGAIIERPIKDIKEILLVKTHKWGSRYSIVGGKVRRGERLHDALLREVHEETGLSGEVGRHLITFDQIDNSGYYRHGVQHVFVDNVVAVNCKKVALNNEAQEYIWAPAAEALSSLNIEPNARRTIEIYAKSQK